mmetsp:Transcript_34068/g.101479  ORF Transcript_34068/g.101479 Transcript_34068/m.101479 type:complete len:263 (-) Transcript_34068:16-804(-)
MQSEGVLAGGRAPRSARLLAAAVVAVVAAAVVVPVALIVAVALAAVVVAPVVRVPPSSAVIIPRRRSAAAALVAVVYDCGAAATAGAHLEVDHLLRLLQRRVARAVRTDDVQPLRRPVLAVALAVVVEEHEDAVLLLHLAQRRALGAEQEPDRRHGHVERLDVLPLLHVLKVNVDAAAVALLQRDFDGEPRALQRIIGARQLGRVLVDVEAREREVLEAELCLAAAADQVGDLVVRERHRLGPSRHCEVGGVECGTACSGLL